jgi:hypothetical protein
MDADGLTRTRPKTPSEILSRLRDNPPGQDALQEPASDPGDTALLDPLPKASDAYLAHARASNKPQLSLFVMLKDGSFDGFSYANLERIRLQPAADAGGGNELVLRFNGSTVTEVRLAGRNLGLLHAYLGQHRTAWVRVLPPERDFQEKGVAVITGIALKDL